MGNKPREKNSKNLNLIQNLIDCLILFFTVSMFTGQSGGCSVGCADTEPSASNVAINCTFPNSKNHVIEYDYMENFDIRSGDFDTYFTASFLEASITVSNPYNEQNSYQVPYDAMESNQNAAFYLGQYAELNYSHRDQCDGYLAIFDKILNYPSGEIGGITIRFSDYPELDDPSFVFAGNAPTYQGDIIKTSWAIHEIGHQLGLDKLDHENHSSDVNCCIMRSPLNIGSCGNYNTIFCKTHKCKLNGHF